MPERRPLPLPADHPALAGHFPGQPVFPAVVLLEAVRGVLAEATPDLRLLAVSQAKFLRPVTPGMAVELSWEQEGRRIRFRCLHEGAVVASGELAIEGVA